MTSGLDLVTQMTPQAAGGGVGDTGQGPAKAPSTFSERFLPAFSATLNAPDDFWNARNAQSERFQKISDDYFALTNERLQNPYDVSITREEMRKYPNMPIPYVLQKRLTEARDKTQALRANVEQGSVGGGLPGGMPEDYLNVDSINPSIGRTGEAMRQANESLIGTGNGAAAFLGETAGGALQPHMVATMMLPVSKLPVAVAEGIGRTFLGNVGREALLQGGIQGGAAAVGEAAGYGTRQQFGTAPTGGEIIQNILGATIGGAAFGGTLRATHLGLDRLIHGPRAEVRPGESSPEIEVPPSVQGAAQVIQMADAYGGMNKLGVPEPVHDRAYLSALNDVALGHGATVDMELPRPNIHDAVRETHPELMGRYDQLSQTREDLRSQLAPTDETIAHLKQQVDEVTAQIQSGGPKTQAEAEALGRQAKVREQMLEDATQRKAALESGAAPEETTVTTSLRQQLAATDAEMRDMVGEIRKAYGEHGAAPPPPGEAPPPPGSAEAGQSEPRLTPEENTEVRGLQENLADYKRLMSEASAEDKPAWQAAIDSTNDRISEIMQTGPEHQPILQRLADEVRNPPAEEGVRPDFMAAATPTPPEEVAPKTAAVQSAEDKALINEAQALIERPDRTVAQPLRDALRDATNDEAEAAIAVACIAGGGAL